MQASTGVWKRYDTGVNTMPRAAYMSIISLLTLVGIAFAGLVSRISANWEFHGLTFLAMAIAAVAVCGFAGKLAHEHQRASVSLLSFVIITAVLGLLFGPVLSQYAAKTIAYDVVIAAAIVVVAGTVGALISENLEHWKRYLLMATLTLIGGWAVMLVLSAFGVRIIGLVHFWDWVGIALFCLWTVFDLNRAVRVAHTAHNAIDVATQVFLDYANILINLLGLGGSND